MSGTGGQSAAASASASRLAALSTSAPPASALQRLPYADYTDLIKVSGWMSGKASFVDFRMGRAAEEQQKNLHKETHRLASIFSFSHSLCLVR